MNRTRSDFTRREDGATAIIFALALLPIVVLLGFAMDLQRANAVKFQLQASADAAVLAGARQYYAGSEKAEAVTLAYFKQSLSSLSHGTSCSDPVIVTDNETAGITISADCSVETTITGLIGADKINLSTAASARSQQTQLDLALMLDVSGSMSGSKIKDLKTAANNAIDILLKDAGGKTRIAIAPYSTAVNTGAYTEAVVGLSNYDAKRFQPNCVTERPGIAKKTDEAPAAGKWIGYDTVSVGGKAIWCPSSEIVPLSANAAKLKKQINSLTTGGWTAGQLGIAWSWYAIAPDWASIWPAASAPRAYDDPDTIKAVILMTDGSFNTTYDKGQGNSVNQSKVLCKEMRDNGVHVYAVAFKAPPAGQSVLKNCASSPALYFEPEDGDALIEAYGEIAATLSNLRLTN